MRTCAVAHTSVQGCGSSVPIDSERSSLASDASSYRERYTPAATIPDAFNERYDIRARIGQGAFSEVVRAVRMDTRQPVAVKIVRKRASPDDLKFLNTEVAILRRIRHPNVIRLLDVHESDDHVFIVMELATGGDLLERLQERGRFEEPLASKTIAMILRGLLYLHSQQITHRDMKPENLLYYHPGADSKLMISDFGLANISRSPEESVMTTACGSAEYLAPEIVASNPYTSSVDLWSLGVIAYFILCGYLPFESSNRTLLFRQILAADYEFHMPVRSVITHRCPLTIVRRRTGETSHPRPRTLCTSC